MFRFRNMQTFIRNCIEPHVVAINTKMNAMIIVDVGWIGIWPVAGPFRQKEKWLKCDGTIFDTNKFNLLYSVLGTNRVPDYRGLFLRGEGGNAASIGTSQGDSISSHSHGLSSHTHKFDDHHTGIDRPGYPHQFPMDPSAGRVRVVSDINISGPDVTWDYVQLETFGDFLTNTTKSAGGGSTTSEGSTEVRPVNKTVQFWIRALA